MDWAFWAILYNLIRLSSILNCCTCYFGHFGRLFGQMFGQNWKIVCPSYLDSINHDFFHKTANNSLGHKFETSPKMSLITLVPPRASEIGKDEINDQGDRMLS
jgi:hypothetical protein